MLIELLEDTDVLESGVSSCRRLLFSPDAGVAGNPDFSLGVAFIASRGEALSGIACASRIL